MKAIESWNNRPEQLNSPAKPVWFGTSSLTKLAHWLLTSGKSFFIDPLNYAEPNISQVADNSGNLWWIVKDPRTQHTYRFNTEGEVRIWLERQYYPG